jgi:SMODS and SLOG-associating 2TM effector domain 2
MATTVFYGGGEDGDDMNGKRPSWNSLLESKARSASISHQLLSIAFPQRTRLVVDVELQKGNGENYIMPNKTSPFPKWDNSNPNESIDLLYNWTLEKSLLRINWYKKGSRKKKMGSQIIRAAAIILVGIGALCPLLNATDVFGKDYDAIGQWGYVVLALAATAVGYDKFFGLSTGWIRYISTQMTLERMMAEFQYDWVILQTKLNYQLSPDSILLSMQKFRDYTVQVESLVKQETDAWAAEFQNNLAELQKMLSTEAEKRKPGSIKVVVTDVREFTSVSISVDGTHVKELSGVSEGIIESVAPGYHEVIASGKRKNGKESKETRVVQVSANSICSAEFALSNLS